MRARKVAQAINRLQSRYGAPDAPAPRAPLEVLLASIMMDAVPRNRAYDALEHLKKRFVDWNEARVSTGKEISELCSPIHLPESAGRNVQRALEKIYSDWNKLALDPLQEKNAKDAREYLQKFEGVSPAAIAYTMLYGLQKSAVPLTPPVLRVAERMGLVEEGSGVDRAQRSLERIVPSARMAAFFELFQQHAEEVCHSKEPKCGRCVTVRLCGFRRKPKATQKVVSRRPRRAVSARRVKAAGRIASRKAGRRKSTAR